LIECGFRELGIWHEFAQAGVKLDPAWCGEGDLIGAEGKQVIDLFRAIFIKEVGEQGGGMIPGLHPCVTKLLENCHLSPSFHGRKHAAFRHFRIP
jgi:hypothetical protein